MSGFELNACSYFLGFIQTWKSKAIRKSKYSKEYFSGMILKVWPVFKWMQENNNLIQYRAEQKRDQMWRGWGAMCSLTMISAATFALPCSPSHCEDSQVTLKFVSSLFTSVKVMCTELNSSASLEHTKVKATVIVHNLLYYFFLFFNSWYYGYCFHSLQ